MGTNARTHAKGLVREASRQQVLPANSKCLINTRWHWVLVVWPKLLVRAPGLGRSSGWMVAKRRLEPWFFQPQLWSTDRRISSQHGSWGDPEWRWSRPGGGACYFSLFGVILVSQPCGCSSMGTQTMLTYPEASYSLARRSQGPWGRAAFCCFERLSCFTSWLFLGRSTCLCALLVQTPAGKWGQGTEVEPGSPHDQLQGPHCLSVRPCFISPKPSILPLWAIKSHS